MARVEVDPYTGQEYIAEDADVPQALTPAGPQIGREEPVASFPTPLVKEPPGTPGTPEPEVGPGFMERIGGPRPGQRMGGMMETLGQYATSDMGRNIIGALGVGLAGLRNTRDNGQLQSQLMQMHLQGAGERAKENRQAAAMTDLWGAMTEASKMISAGDLEGASTRLAQLAKNRTIMGNPAAMGELLKLNAQLEARAGSKRALQSLAEGPEIASGRDLIKRGGEAGLTLDEIAKVGPLVTKPQPKVISHFDNNTQQAVLIYPDSGKVSILKYGEGDLPTKLKDITDPDTRRELESKGIHIPTFIKAYNAGDPQAIAQLAAAASTPRPSREGTSEAERSAEKEIAADEKAGKVKFNSKEERDAAIAARIQQRKVEVAGATTQANRDVIRLENRNQPTREALKAGGGIVELKSGEYREVSNKFKTIGEAQDAEARGEVSIIPDRVGFEDVQKKKNSLATLRDIEEIGKRVYTKDNLGGVLKQGTEAFLKGKMGTGELGRDVRKLGVLRATVFDIAKGLGNDARISDADAKFAMTAMSTDTLFQTAESFKENMALVQKIFQRGLDRAARNERAPENEHIAATAGTGEYKEVAPGVFMRKVK